MSRADWKKVSLKSLCHRIGDGLHGTPKYTQGSNIHFINGNNLKNGKIVISDDTKEVSEQELKANYIKLDQNSLLLSINGTLGQMAFYEGQKVMLGKSSAYLNFKTEVNQFYYYYFQLKEVQKYFYNVATGSTIKNLSLKSIQDFEVPLPKETEWKKIAHVLSTLDEKIEVNNKINAELEAMAKLVYDYWFVQFDFPNEEGKPYKSSGGKMVYSEVLKREVPEGSSVGIASDLFDFNPTESVKKGSECSYIDMNALPIQGFMTKPVQRKSFNGGMKFRNGDVSVARITPCLENGKTALITLLDDNEIGFGSTEFIILRGKDMSMSCFAAYLCRSEIFRKYAIMNMTGTSGRKRVDAKALEIFSMPIPEKKILEKFEKLVTPFFTKATNNTKENQQLTSLRDWLLPMLMNGQVRVE